MFQRMLSTLFAAAVAYLFILGLLYVMQFRLTYFPDPTPLPDPKPLGGEAVALTTADGLTLTAWWFPPKDANGPVLLYCHGNASHLANRADKFAAFTAHGFGMLAVSYRGYGGNPGTPREEGLYADARAARQWLDQKGIAKERIVYYGESLGSGVVTQLATESPPALLVLEAPYTSIVDVGKLRFPYIPVAQLMRERFDSFSKITRIHAPLLILHGEKDVTVPVKLGRRLLEAANEPKRGVFFPEVGHTDFDLRTLADEVFKGWEEK
ncbi:MAG: alpha/beta hydrolase [Alphaproteobacteria bacterium]|nr:alpha/beta hydrolase [Alphaproteobacteria bacterium]